MAHRTAQPGFSQEVRVDVDIRAQRMAFGDLLRRYRAAAGLTQEGLAERAGLSAKSISALERGVNRGARKDTAALLAQALSLAPRERTTFEAAARRRGHLPPPSASVPPREDNRPPLTGRAGEQTTLDGCIRGDRCGAARRAVLHRRVAEALEREPGELPVEQLAYHYSRSGERLKAATYLEEAARVLEQALPSLQIGGEQRDLAYALNNLAAIYRIRGDFTRAQRHFEQALEVAERVEDVPLIAYLSCHRAEHAYIVGDWSMARACYARGATLNVDVGTSWSSPYPLLGMGQLNQAEGQWDEARRQLEVVIVLAERSGDLEALQPAESALAECEILCGQAAQARGRLEPLVNHARQQQSNATGLLPLLAWAYLATGNAGQAEELATRAVHQARDEQNRVALVDALRVQAMILAHADGERASQDALDEAEALCRTMGYPYAEAKVLYTGGLVDRQMGKSERARDRLERALTLCQQLGERLYAEQIEQALTGGS